MEFKIKQSVLKEELGFIQGVVERKTTIPVLSNILIESIGEKEIRIVGTDLDCTIRCDAEADIIQPGSICVQARKLFDIVRALDSGDVHFKKEDNEWVTLKAGRANYRLAGVSKDQFPEIPNFKSTPMRLPAEVFGFFVRNTAFAITNEQSRFTLSGAKFIIGDGVARMVTTDGHRLAYVERAIDDKDGVMDTLIPKKALTELVKLSRGAGDVAFGEDTNHIYFETEGRLLITRKLTGQFPNYEMVMPKDNDKTAIFDLDEMNRAVRRMALIADERNRSIRLTVREGEIEVTAQSSEQGEGSEVVQADYKGEEMQLGFNHQYLLEFLQNVGSAEMIAAEAQSAPAEVAASEDSSSPTAAATAPAREGRTPVKIAFEFKDPNAQTQMSIAGETTYDYKYIVMPLRI
ncbi:MAG: DNA polymerase III subunit beta [Acidobacteria bacterium]|nr:DNA polymerase III subunit beta [Acidobacteriota bacterium]MBP7474364.1 DNA polymerase III subunit beta [Pyrinomonadaceae bacterium]MBP9109261.1 DNA polymerase III subunit beta [Pyrinomonadaceae bacterium]